MLEAKVDSLDNVPEALQDHYVEKDGSYILGVSGMVDKSKVDDFRENNVKLMKKMESLESSYGKIDLDEYEKLRSVARRQKDKKLIDAGKVEELVEERTKRMKEEYEEQIKGLSTQNETYNRQLEGLVIDNAVRELSAKEGALATAGEDILLRARSAFKLVDGQATPHDTNGHVIYGADGVTPMAVNEWMKGLTQSAPHLFATSTGSGSQHGNRSNSEGRTVTRNEFDNMSQLARSEYAKKGGKVVDN